MSEQALRQAQAERLTLLMADNRAGYLGVIVVAEQSAGAPAVSVFCGQAPYL